MKLGMICYPDENGFNYMKKLGLDVCEITTNSLEDTNSRIALKDSIIKSVAETGITICSVGRWGQDKVLEGGVVCPDAIAENKRLIDFCAEIGAPVFNFGVNYCNSVSKYRNIEITYGVIKDIVQYAQDKGVTPAIYNCSWSNHVYGPEMWDIYLDEFPTLGIKFDPSHTFDRGAKYLEETMSYGKRFVHTHVKGVIKDGRGHYDNPPAGLDSTDWNAYFGCLYYVGYDAALSIEPHSSIWHGEIGDKGIEHTVKFVRGFML